MLFIRCIDHSTTQCYLLYVDDMIITGDNLQSSQSTFNSVVCDEVTKAADG